MTLRHSIIASPIDNLTLVAEDEYLVGLYFEDHRTGVVRSGFGPSVPAESDPVLSQVRSELNEYFHHGRREFDVKVTSHGSDFEESVWSLLREIPFGDRITYGDIANALGNRHFSQQVGQAVGHNSIGIIVPCHRVIGANGKLVGYAGGLPRKQFLLDLERPDEMRNARLF